MSERREFRELADPETVRATIAELPIEPGTERVSLAEANGRVLGKRVDATIDVPGFDRATMDGYAVRAVDTFGADERDPVVLEPGGTVHAGEAPDVEVREDTAIEISTGAVLPPGADAVVMVERSRETEDGIAIESPVAPGDHVMTAGSDIGAGQRALGPGRLLTAREIALLAALGFDEVTVRRRPRVGIVSTGDELVRPGEPIDHGRGQIFDVNSHAIAAAVAAAGGEPVLYPHAGDAYAEMRRILETASEECHLVLSSGSTSASAVDVIYEVVEDHGDVLHHGVAVKPGKPMLIGRMGPNASAYVGLPGYPVSALMVFRQFVGPTLRAAAGLPPATDATRHATMAADERFGEGRMRLLPVGLVYDGEGALIAYPVDKGSGATTSLVDADGVVEVPADTAYVAAGEGIDVHLFSPDLRPPALLGVGEDDPAFSRILDVLPEPKYVPVGSNEGCRRFERGIPDVAVVSRDRGTSLNGTTVARWVRRWGLIVPLGNPDGIDAVADLVDREVRFANLRATALGSALDGVLEALAEDRDASLADVSGNINGYGLGRPAHGSAGRLVANGDADVGLGLESTAAELGMGFIRIGEQELLAVTSPDRETKAGVERFCTTMAERLPGVIDALPGYRIPESAG